MYRIPADRPVRRRLFPADDDSSRVDNFVNTLQESSATDNLVMSKKWNFDFKNEVPLKGPYKWFRLEDPNKWVAYKSEEIGSGSESNEEDKLLPIQLENEATPEVSSDKSEITKLRKRKRNRFNSVRYPVRRKIDF